jgi:hypothetical protein
LKTRFKRLAVSLSLVLVVAGLSTFAIQSPALASYSSCPGSSICAYSDSNGNGAQYVLPWVGLNNCQGMPAGWNDVVSSAINKTPSYKVVFYSEGCWGGTITVWPGGTQNGFWPMNDATSSWEMQLA